MSGRGTIKFKSVLFGTAISCCLTGLMWAFKLMPLLIWITLPGWLLAWGTIIVLHGEHWVYFDAIERTLITVGNAGFYTWICFLIIRRKEKTAK